MTDEPSNGELARRLDAFGSRFDEIARLLQGLIARGEYTEYQQRVEQRFTRLEIDVADKRRIHDEDMRDLHQEIKDLREENKELRAKVDEGGKESGVNFRQAVYMGLVPGIILVIGLLVTVLLAKGGK